MSRVIHIVEWVAKVLLWLVLSIVAIVVVPFAVLLANSEGRLPYWARWFETPDALGWDANLYEPSMARIRNKRLRLMIWLGLRNRALGFQYWAGHVWPQRIDSYAGLKRSGRFWRFDYYGAVYFGAGWKSHRAEGAPMLAVPFLTLRFGR
ncbi:MAG TPA: hypothetical protein VFS42_06885 [Burkholderiaceae bacterium]|nr:hypothetical protein [Burkholderiaceae bacterium]